MLYYKPHPKQNAFHQAGREFDRRMFLGSNGCGKTLCGSREALAWAHGYYFWKIPGLTLNEDRVLPPRDSVSREFWVFRSDGIPIKVPNLGCCVTGLNHRLGIGQVMWPAFRDGVPNSWNQDHSWKIYWGPNNTPQQIRFPNGSEVIMYSRDQDPITFEGVEADWAWFDEPVPEYCYNGTWRGVSRAGGSVWFTLTPLGATSRWIYFKLFKSPKVFKITATQVDNPYMTKDLREKFEEGLTGGDREKRARVEGEFEFLGNAVFTNFEERTHVLKAFPIPKHWIHGVTIDPHHKKAAFILWWAVDPETAHKPVYHFYREWPAENYFEMSGGGLTYDEYAALIRGIERDKPAEIRIVDPRFGKAEWTIAGESTTCWSDEMAMRGLYFDTNVPETKLLETGHLRISQMLDYDHRFPIGPTNTPRIFIHDTCPNTITGLGNYAYLDVKDAEKGTVEKVSEEFKEPIDCVRYTVLYPLARNDLIDMRDGAGMFSVRDLIDANDS